jgi:hypothetical protein
LLFLAIVYSHILNIQILPSFGKTQCDFTKLTNERISLWNEISNKSYTYNTTLEEIQILAEKHNALLNDFNSKAKKHQRVFISYIPSAIVQVGEVKLFSDFPVACEIFFYIQNIKAPPSCRYYLSEEDYRCIKEDYEKKKASNKTMGGFLNYSFEFPLYRRQSFFFFLFFLTTRVALFYVLLSFVAYFNKHLSQKSLKTKLFITTFFALGGFFMVMAYKNIFGIDDIFDMFISVFSHPELAFFTAFLIFYIMLVYVDGDKPRTIASWVFLAILIVAVLGLILIPQKVISMGIDAEPYKQSEFSRVSCDSFRIFNETDKQKLGITDSNEWKECNNPDCNKLCDNNCNSSRIWTIVIRGDNPSCICGCEN